MSTSQNIQRIGNSTRHYFKALEPRLSEIGAKEFSIPIPGRHDLVDILKQRRLGLCNSVNVAWKGGILSVECVAHDGPTSIGRLRDVSDDRFVIEALKEVLRAVNHEMWGRLGLPSGSSIKDLKEAATALEAELDKSSEYKILAADIHNATAALTAPPITE